MKAVSISGHRLTFHWPASSRISLTFIGLILFSVFLHALAFYLFQVIYPSVVAVTPPPAQVSILAPTTPENEELLKWIDAEDPAVIANPHEVTPPGLRDLSYKPSFAEVRTTPKTLDEKQAEATFPPAAEAAEIVNNALTPAVKVEPVSVNQKTDLKFFGLLARRKIATRPPLEFHPSTRTSLEPVSYLVGVDSDGTVRYISSVAQGVDNKVQNGSGDPVIDSQAEEYLGGIKFAPGGKGTTWGMVTFYWGSDAFDSSVHPSTP